MKVEVFAGEAATARAAAKYIAAGAVSAVASRGRFMMAVSGGRTPWIMLRALAALIHTFPLPLPPLRDRRE